jgi:hypothetical protein
MSATDALLGRLNNVRAYGPKGWRADCPNGHSSRGTLSVGEADDGRVLLRCFAGCSAAEVMGAVGLTLSDLFPEPVRDMGPMARAQRREAIRQAGWAAALAVLAREAVVVHVAAEAMVRGEPIVAEDAERVRVAAERIQDAREALA